MRVRWFVGIPWWIALWFYVVGFLFAFALAVFVVIVLFALALSSGVCWLTGALVAKRWPAQGTRLQRASRMLWVMLDTLAGWADQVGLGRRPR